MTYKQVLNQQREVLLAHVKWCDSFFARFRGLMLRRALAQDEGLVLAYSRASIVDSSIHMFFVNFDIAAIWLDDQQRIVHKILARRWRPYYASPQPARYVLEGPPDLLDRIQLGEQLSFANKA